MRCSYFGFFNTLLNTSKFNLSTFIIFYSVLMVATPSHSASLLIDGNEVYGATGVEVNGLLYDVEIIDSSCSLLYNGCDDVSDFLFTNVTDATAAAQALLDQVLMDIFGNPSQQFNTDPELTRGCSNSGLCRILTPYGLLGDGNIIGTTADNHSINPNDIVTPNVGITAVTDLSLPGYTLATYAVWTATVPLPPAALLFASSLAVFVGLRRRSPNGYIRT